MIHDVLIVVLQYVGHDDMLTHKLLLIFQVSLLPLFLEQMKKNKVLEVALYQESRLANTGSEPV